MGRERYGRWNDYGYTLPEDPWVIQARFKKQGMFPPGVAHPSSTHSSRVNLAGGDEDKRRRGSTVSSSGNVSMSGSAENVAATGPAPLSATNSLGSNPDGWPAPDESVWVYVTIQLYSIEKDFYLVDFKCAGYERLVQRFAKEMTGSEGTDVVQVRDGEGEVWEVE